MFSNYVSFLGGIVQNIDLVTLPFVPDPDHYMSLLAFVAFQPASDNILGGLEHYGGKKVPGTRVQAFRCYSAQNLFPRMVGRPVLLNPDPRPKGPYVLGVL